MIRALTLTLAIAGFLFVATTPVTAATIYKAKHGGTITTLGDYGVELVTVRKENDVDFTVYVEDPKAAPITQGNLVLSIMGPNGKPQEVILKPDTSFFRGNATIIERGPIEIRETFTTVGGAPSFTVIKHSL